MQTPERKDSIYVRKQKKASVVTLATVLYVMKAEKCL